MSGSKFSDLVDLMGDIRDVLVTYPRQYISAFEFSSTADTPLALHRVDQLFFPNTELSHDGGGTNFGNAINRGIQVISDFKYEDTCFVFITDGLAPYPGSQIAAMNSLLSEFESFGYFTCVVCYYIGDVTVPNDYLDMCNALGAVEVRGASDATFERAFSQSFTNLSARVLAPNADLQNIARVAVAPPVRVNNTGSTVGIGNSGGRNILDQLQGLGGGIIN